MIGFGCDPAELLNGNETKLFCYELDPTTGLPPQTLEQPVAPYPPHYKVAHGANPDTSMPVQYWSDWALDTFLRQRGLRLRGKYVRDNSL